MRKPEDRPQTQGKAHGGADAGGYGPEGMGAGQPQRRDLKRNRGEGEPRQQRQHPGKKAHRQNQQKDQTRRQHDGTAAGGQPENHRPDCPVSEKQQKQPGRSGTEAGFPFPPERGKEPGKQIRFPAPDAVRHGIIEGCGGPAEGEEGNGTERPQTAQNHRIAHMGKGLPVPVVRGEKSCHFCHTCRSRALRLSVLRTRKVREILIIAQKMETVTSKWNKLPYPIIVEKMFLLWYYELK